MKIEQSQKEIKCDHRAESLVGLSSKAYSPVKQTTQREFVVFFLSIFGGSCHGQ